MKKYNNREISKFKSDHIEPKIAKYYLKCYPEDEGRSDGETAKVMGKGANICIRSILVSTKLHLEDLKVLIELSSWRSLDCYISPYWKVYLREFFQILLIFGSFFF